jgi:hypothetical protein
MFLFFPSYSTQPHKTKMANHDENGMNEYDRITDEWNRSDEVRRRRTLRMNEINTTPEYYTGNRIHHLRTIQMHSLNLWNQLFLYEAADPVMREYSQASIRFAEDTTQTHLFAGQMEVSLILQENYRPGVHVAIFIIQLAPHRQFYDGHVIQREFGEGSATHQIINRLFNTDDRAVVSQATEYDILGYIADDDDMRYLLDRCFMDPDFTTVQYIYVMNDDNEGDDGYYVVDYHGGNAHEHQVHDFEVVPAAPRADAIPPPPPAAAAANNFPEIYQQYYNNDYNHGEYNNNIIPYDDSDDDDSDDSDSDDSDSDDSDSDYEVRG